MINIAHNITTFAMSLPGNANSEGVSIVVIQPPHGGDWESRDLIASASRVQHALVYLIAHNPGYAGIWIDLDRLQALRDGSLEVDLMDFFLTIEDPDDNHGDDNVGGNDTRDTSARQGRDYRAIGAHNPEDDGNVQDPADAAGRETRPPRPPRESFIASDGLGV